MPIPIPPLADQRRVVARGDALIPETLDPATAVELEEAE